MKAVPCYCALVSAGLLVSPAQAQDAPSVDLSGDIRLRLEQDWNSRTAAGVERPERTRARYRDARGM